MIDKYNEVGISALERTGNGTAKPAEECAYPCCEDCINYHGHYCTVPMVVSKQIWLTTESLIARMEKRLTELETLVTDEILRSDKSVTAPSEVDLNLTWEDYLGEDK